MANDECSITLDAAGVPFLTQSVQPSAVIPHTRSALIYRATVASSVNRCGRAALLCNTSRTRNHAFARALHVLLVQLERVSSSRWVSEAGSAIGLVAVRRSVLVLFGGTVTGRHETECGQRLKPVTESQRAILAFAALSVCVLCFL